MSPYGDGPECGQALQLERGWGLTAKYHQAIPVLALERLRQAEQMKRVGQAVNERPPRLGWPQRDYSGAWAFALGQR